MDGSKNHNIDYLNNIVIQLNLLNMYRSLHWIIENYSFKLYDKYLQRYTKYWEATKSQEISKYWNHRVYSLLTMEFN